MTGQLAIVKKIQFLIGKASRKMKVTQQLSASQVLFTALEETEKLSDVSEKVLYLNDIANVYATLGLTERCTKVLNQALEHCQMLDYGSTKATELSKIGSRYVKLGLTDQGFELLDQALKLAQSIDDIDERDLTFCDVACAYGEVGQSDKTLEIANLIEDELRTACRVFSPLAIEHIWLGQYDQATRFIQAAQKTGYEALVIGDVIEACAEVGDYNYPLQFVEMTASPTNKISILTDLAKVHLEAGHRAEASELLSQTCAIAQTIDDHNSKAFAKARIESIRAQMAL